jgi:hypothetical protein
MTCTAGPTWHSLGVVSLSGCSRDWLAQVGAPEVDAPVGVYAAWPMQRERACQYQGTPMQPVLHFVLAQCAAPDAISPPAAPCTATPRSLLTRRGALSSTYPRSKDLPWPCLAQGRSVSAVRRVPAQSEAPLLLSGGVMRQLAGPKALSVLNYLSSLCARSPR